MKKYFVIGLALLTTCLVGCSKSEPEESVIIEENYAVNETKPADSKAEYNGEPEVPVTTEVKTEPATIPHEPRKKYTFNTEEDINALDVKDMNTISIDGKMISFPCDYSDLKKEFELYQIAYSRVGDIPMDVNETDKNITFSIFATPTTGDGRIEFIFTSKNNESQTINDMICREVNLSVDSTDNEKLMTFALPNDIVFGSSYETIRDTYYYFDMHEMNDTSDVWLLKTLSDEDYVITFHGNDRGLVMLNIRYKEE